MGRSKSSHRWLKEHFDDHYVHQAQADGYRARSAYKLLQLNDKDGLIKPGQTVVDLGAAPGGWCQVVSRLQNGRGRIIALDILAMEALPGVEFIQGDFTEDQPLAALETALAGAAADLVLSDMAPNMSGIEVADQARGIYLAELALDFCRSHLRNGGNFVVKVFQGQGFDQFLQQCRDAFAKVIIRKPKASRPRSREVYLVALGHMK